MFRPNFQCIQIQEMQKPGKDKKRERKKIKERRVKKTKQGKKSLLHPEEGKAKHFIRC